MNKTIFIAAMFAVATVLAAGLTVLPGSVQEAHANLCADEVTVEIENEDSENPDGQSVTLGLDED